MPLQKRSDLHWKPIREKRDKLLASTDSYVLADRPISDEDRAMIYEYREALRNITNVQSTSDVVWPTPPQVIHKTIAKVELND